MPSVEYFLQSWDDCMAGRPSSCPIMDIQLTSVALPELATRGGQVMSNWVLYENPELREGSWSSLRDEIGERINRWHHRVRTEFPGQPGRVDGSDA